MDLPLVLLLIASGLWGCAMALAAHRLPPILDAIIRQQLGQHLTRAGDLGLPHEIFQQILRLWPISVVVLFVAIWRGLGMLPLALVVTGLVYVAPRLLILYLIRLRENRLRDQMVGTAVGLANATRAGLSLAQGLETVAAEAAKPIATVLQRIVIDYRRGLPLQQAISVTRRRLNIEPFTLFAAAIHVSLDRGGRIHEALDRISSSLQDHQRLERKMLADTASGRRVVQILAIFPALFVGGFYLLSPETTSVLFTDFWGQIVLAATIVLVYIGVRWARRIMDLKV